MKKRIYTKEFKLEAIKLAEELDSYSEASRQLGLADSTIHTWKKRLKSEKAINLSDTELENKKLRKEVAELKKVNSILKSAAAFFSQDHLK